MSKLIEQASDEKLKRQQQVLTHLGFYKGKIDGIWGPKTIEAKRNFESAGFAPGIPNGGLPFHSKGPYPKGLFMQSGFLMCAGFNPADYEPKPVQKLNVKVRDAEPTPAVNADDTKQSD